MLKKKRKKEKRKKLDQYIEFHRLGEVVMVSVDKGGNGYRNADGSDDVVC